MSVRQVLEKVMQTTLKYKIYPDIAMFGKAIGNGYALTAIIGKENNE